LRLFRRETAGGDRCNSRNGDLQRRLISLCCSFSQLAAECALNREFKVGHYQMLAILYSFISIVLA
jgi:hypothetical protein